MRSTALSYIKVTMTYRTIDKARHQTWQAYPQFTMFLSYITILHFCFVPDSNHSCCLTPFICYLVKCLPSKKHESISGFCCCAENMNSIYNTFSDLSFFDIFCFVILLFVPHTNQMHFWTSPISGYSLDAFLVFYKPV